MNRTLISRHLLATLVAIVALATASGRAAAQSLSALNAELSQLSPRVSAAISGSDYAEAGEVVGRLDQAEANFAKIAEGLRADKSSLAGTYERLEQMLDRMYTAFKQKKEDCIAQVDSTQCDYDQPEQISLRALYPLSWLRYQGSFIYASQPSMARRLLNQAIDGFTESTVVIVAPDLIRENLLGRAFCERELGKFDKSEYEKAIADFKAIMKDGSGTKQYRAAQQGLATTYAAMGKMVEAARMSGQLAEGAYGSQREGMEMLRLQNLLKAEAAASDPDKRAAYHQEALDFMREKQGDRDSWAVVLAAVARNVREPIAEFGRSSDPFEKWLLANVLYSKKEYSEAAKYFVQAARSGRYPKGYKFAADIYYSQGRHEAVQELVDEIARQPGNPDAQWASYMRFKLAHYQWQQGGGKNTQLEQRWAAAARDYLKSYPRGQYAYEPRFRLAEVEQRNKQYLQAAQDYGQVAGNADYEFHARFNAAECYYLALVEAVNAQNVKDHKKTAESIANVEQLRKATKAALQTAIGAAPAAERRAPSERAGLRDLRGRAIYMLANLLEREHKVDYPRVATLLAGYEEQYPRMEERFNEIAGWRVRALDELGRYPELERDVRAIVERNRNDVGAADFMKEIGLGFWKNAASKGASGDLAGAQADIKLTAIAYSYFEDQVQAGRIPAKNLTGTLSILGKAYIGVNDVPKAEAIFSQVVKADPGSPDANAGLARIAQAKKDYKNAVELWTRVESVAAESDDVWYEAKYNVAKIYADQGNITGACNKLAVTRSEHPSLGTPQMKAQWDALQRQFCLKGNTN
jgi:hypothetical protein